MAASELADWWDKQRKESEKILEEWVDENPQWWAVGIATATSTAMELGAGMVDALRFGEGVAQGGWRGYGKDALRLLALVGPLGKGGALAGRFAQTQMIRLAVTTADVTGPCTFTAVNNAASIVGGRARNFFVLAEDAAEALGQKLSSVPKIAGDFDLGAWIEELVPFLTKQGVRLKNLGRLATIDEVVAAAAAEDGVVVFAIEWADQAGNIQKHSLIAVRTLSGVKFADYGGKFFSSLSELAQRGPDWVPKAGRYLLATAEGASGRPAIQPSMLFEGMKVFRVMGEYASKLFKGGFFALEGVQAINTPGDGVRFALPAAPVAVIDTAVHDPAMVKASFDAFKERKAGKEVLRLPPIEIRGNRKGPPRADWLTGVQYRLNALGFGAGPVDGVNGPKTVRAVTTFQKAYPPLKVDGIPGPKTQAKLVEICGF